jgi:hypothetical protein
MPPSSRQDSLSETCGDEMDLGDFANPWVAGAIVAVVALAVLLAVMHAGRPTPVEAESGTPDETDVSTNRSFLKQLELYGRH